MQYTYMMWYRRANMACLAGGADIVPDEPLDEMDKLMEEARNENKRTAEAENANNE